MSRTNGPETLHPPRARRSSRGLEAWGDMKVKTKHRKSYKWRKQAATSPTKKGRRVKIRGIRNPRKRKHLGGKGL